MCGIVGYYRLERKPGHPAVPVEAMLDKVRHRGPDEMGIVANHRAALGHTRLSIIDVTGGHQPLSNETGTLWLTLNGEIRNYKALKENLRKHRFQTRTDTEVIVHLYEEHGPDCVKYLDGMFAFALLDGDELFLARDPLGVKPLYYGIKDDYLYFASEIKALLPVTQEIVEFPPGYCFHSAHGFHQYFDLEKLTADIEELDDIEAEVRKRLSRAVEKRLMADMPVGVFLSGGLDSSLIAALMKEQIQNLHSFSVGIAGSSDLAYARQAAKFLGTQHHERVFSREEILEILPRVIYHLESFDFALVRSAIANYFVAQLARQFVKVVLVGEGSDELFGGYHYLKQIGDKDELQRELVAITAQLHNSNLQRVDRMTMAHGLEGREPYLDLALIRLALAIPPALKQHHGVEKWVLRRAFEGALPDEVLWREKEKFSSGAGSALVFERIAEREISDREFERERQLTDNFQLRSKEELYYYRIWQRYFPDSVVSCLGWTHSPGAR